MRDAFVYTSIIALAVFAVVSTITIIVLANKPPRIQISTMPFLIFSKRSTGDTSKKRESTEDYIWTFYMTPPEIHQKEDAFEDVLSLNLGIKMKDYKSEGVSVSQIQPRYDDYESHQYKFETPVMVYRIDFNGRPIMSFSPQKISSFIVFWEDGTLPKLVELNGEFYSINGKKCINNEQCEDVENLRRNDTKNVVHDTKK